MSLTTRKARWAALRPDLKKHLLVGFAFGSGVCVVSWLAAGNVQINSGGATLYLIGLPTSSPGVPAGAVWKDGSGYLRIA